MKDRLGRPGYRSMGPVSWNREAARHTLRVVFSHVIPHMLPHVFPHMFPTVFPDERPAHT
jgi:hypothetical protein